MTFVVRRSAQRFVTRSPGIETRHCFSFGPHYDPAHLGHGPLLVHDEHRLDAGAGFAPHPHRDVEVVSWVLEGALVHEHDGRVTVVPAGGMQRMTAGTGVVHVERAAAVPTRFVQLWLAAPAPDLVPSYALVDPPAGEGLAQVLPEVHLARLAAGSSVRLPQAAHLHVYVGRGRCALDHVVLEEGDSARLTAGVGPTLHARGPVELLVVAASRVRSPRSG